MSRPYSDDTLQLRLGTRSPTRPPRPPLRPSWTPSEPPYVIIPCSGAKAPGACLPAVDRYTGSLYRAALATARRLTEDRFIRIASARYGLCTLDKLTEPYDRRLDALGKDDLRQWQSWIQGDACSMWADWSSFGRPGAPVILFVPKFYAEQLMTAPLLAANAHRPFEGCAGIGEMRHVLATYEWRPTTHTPYIYSRGREVSRQEYEGNFTPEEPHAARP